MSLIIGKRASKESTICEVIEAATKNPKGMNELKQTMLFDKTHFDKFYQIMHKNAYYVTPRNYPAWSAISFYCAKYCTDFYFFKAKFESGELSNSRPTTPEDYKKMKEINTGGNISLDIFESLPLTPVYTITEPRIKDILKTCAFNNENEAKAINLQCPAMIVLCPSGALKVSGMGHIEFILFGVTKNSRVSFLCMTSTGMALHVYQVPLHDLENHTLSNFVVQTLIKVVTDNHPIEEWDKTTRNKKRGRYPHQLG